MLYIFCGDDTVASRRQFSQELKRIQSSQIACPSMTDIELAIRELESTSLFQSEQAVALENVLSRASVRTTLSRSLTSLAPTANLYIWESSLDPKLLKKYFPTAQLRISTLPTNLWKYLDALAPGNMKKCIIYKSQIFASVDEHMLLFMMQRRIKDLISVEKKITGKRKLAPWQASQLQSQSRLWGATPEDRMNRLSKLYRKLYDIEVGTKTGTLSFSIQKALDLSLCFYLQ